MLTLRGRRHTFCDGLSRRHFLQLGGLAVGGLTLSDVFRHQAAASSKPAAHKAVIMVFLPGGPSHQDIFDIKTDAPVDIRGEFKAIDTAVPGIQICEHLPRLAAMMERFAIIRSIVGCREEHAADQCLSGYSMNESKQLPGGRPSVGAYLAKLEGPVDKSVPPFVGLAPKLGHTPWGNPGSPGFLGLAYSAFQPQGQVGNDMRRRDLTVEALSDRKELLRSFDAMRRELDASGNVEAMDEFTRRAFEVLTSSRLVEALDLSREDPRLRDVYGQGSEKHVDDGAPCLNQQLLMARRLVEAGVRCVTLSYARWDFHGKNFAQLKTYLPMLEQGLCALVQDLHDRGLANDVSVVVWGEFGRTPRINKDAGRDHWAPVSCCLLAGGGMKTGQVIGSTDRTGGHAKDRPVHVQDVLATLYRNLGIDPGQRTVTGPSGRPMYLLDRTDPIKELV